MEEDHSEDAAAILVAAAERRRAAVADLRRLQLPSARRNEEANGWTNVRLGASAKYVLDA